MKNNLLGILFKSQIFIPLLIFVFYFSLNYIFLFCLTSPSDPLQYVEPAINTNNGFPFFDRIFLWLWIRFVSIFPISLAEIGGVATLTLTSLTLAMGVGYLRKRVGLLASAIFTFLFVMSPFTTGMSSYTYPMQLLTFVLLLTLILYDSLSDYKNKFFILGFGYALAIFSKVQGVGFIFLIFYLIFTYKESSIIKKTSYSRIKAFLASISGFLFSILLIISIILVADGPSIFLKIFSYFSSNYENTGGKSMFLIQAAGRAEGGLPPFHKLFKSATFFIGSISLLVFIFKRNLSSSIANLFSFAALFQISCLIFIYIITQRGGPVIENYFMDFVLLSLIPSSILIESELNNFINKDKLAKLLFFTTLILFLIFIYYLIFHDQRIKLLYLKLGLVIFCIGFYLTLIKQLISNKNSNNLKKHFVLLFIFIWVAIDGIKAVENSLGKLLEAYPYHQVSKLINLIDEKGDMIYVSFLMDRPSAEDATFRLKQVYNTFYANKAVNFFYNSPPNNEYSQIVTDRISLLTMECSSKENITISRLDFLPRIITDIHQPSDKKFKNVWILRGCKN